MQESIVFLVRVQYRRKESSRSLSHLLMSFLCINATFRTAETFFYVIGENANILIATLLH